MDHYYVRVDGTWRQTQDEADFTDVWVDAEESYSDVHSGKAIGFMDNRYFFPDRASALEFFTEQTGREVKPASMTIYDHGKAARVYPVKVAS